MTHAQALYIKGPCTKLISSASRNFDFHVVDACLQSNCEGVLAPGDPETTVGGSGDTLDQLQTAIHALELEVRPMFEPQPHLDQSR